MNVQTMPYINSICQKQIFSKGYNRLFYHISFFCLVSLFALTNFPQVYASAQYDPTKQTLENIKDLSDTVHIAFHDYDIDINFYKGVSNTENHIHSALFSGLVTLDTTTLSIQNNLAISWFINDDFTEYTFHIRKDAMFSDGTTVTAKDVKESWLTILRSKSKFSYLLEPIVGVLQYQIGEGTLDDIGIDVISNKTLQVRLARSTSEFLKIIAHSVFSVTKADFSKLENWENMIRIIPYSGPYIISEIEDTYILLQKNQLYWAKEFVQSQYIVIHFYDNNTEHNLAEDILYGNIHWSTVTVDNEEIDTSWLQINEIFGTDYLFFRTSEEPWNNTAVRTAIRLLIPFDEIRNNYYTFPATSLVPPLNDFYTSPELASDQNIEKASMLLEEAGYPNGDGLPPLIVSVPIFENKHDEIFDTIKSHIEKSSSIIVDIQTRPWDEYFTSPSTDNFVIGYSNWIGDYVSPAAFLQMWISPDKNLGHSYDNKEYRESYLHAVSLSDDENKIEALQDTERILLETTVVIPLSYLYAVNIVRDDILEGWEKNILDQHHFALLYQKEQIPIPFITKNKYHE